MYCTALQTVLHCTVLYCTALDRIVLHCTGPYCTALHWTVFYCTALDRIVLHCRVAGCSAVICGEYRLLLWTLGQECPPNLSPTLLLPVLQLFFHLTSLLLSSYPFSYSSPTTSPTLLLPLLLLFSYHISYSSFTSHFSYFPPTIPPTLLLPHRSSSVLLPLRKIFFLPTYTTNFHRLNMHLRGVYLQNIITPKPLEL